MPGIRVIILARIGGIPELVIPDRTGRLFESASVDSLSDELAAFHVRSDRSELGREARRFVEERFEPDRHLEELTAVYGRVAS